MKKLVIIPIITFLLNTVCLGQSELIISGGNLTSSLVNGNGQVYVWGNNLSFRGSLLGILGVNSTSNYVSSPTLISFPTGTPKMKRVSSGSGAHFLSLDCTGSVWAWGDNEFGQVGNETKGNIVKTPVRVKVLNGDLSIDPVYGNGGFLSNVKDVIGGNTNSFAILNDGRLVAWGTNSNSSYFSSAGQLGDGTILDKLTPVFVKSGISGINGQTAGDPLKNVIKVSAGDNVTYAIVDEDGDGIGTVYSWGNGTQSQLGRAKDGGNNPGSMQSIQSSFAYPVTSLTGEVLGGIKQISAGDVFGMALDTNGNIWSWGNGTWGGCTGTSPINSAHNQPKKVLAGEAVKTADDNEGYLLASFMGAGQGYGMAISMSGKPMAWGNNKEGGIIGNGGLAYSYPTAQFIRRGGNIDGNAIAIYRGDTWGWYLTADKKVYTWGENAKGQLGIGNIVLQNTAVEFVTTTISTKDIAPFVNLGSTQIKTCATNLLNTPIILNNGFNITNPSLANQYVVKWYFNGVQSGTNTNAITGKTFEAKQLGTYKVTIEYIGANGECDKYPIAQGETKIVDCLITGNESISTEENSLISLYPNPFKDELFINLKFNDDALFVLKDIQGKVILENRIENNNSTISTSIVIPGLYFAELHENSKVKILKLIKK